MSKKDYILIGEIAGGVILLLALLLVIYCKVEQQSIVLIITAGVVFWYAWETREMRKHTETQNKLMESQIKISSLPHLAISLKEEVPAMGTFLYKFYASNDGEGPAMDIEFNALQDSGGGKPIFRKIGVLRKREEKEIIVERISMRDGQDIGGDTGISNFVRDNIIIFTESISFGLKFKDILGNGFYHNVVLRNSQFSIS